jgi:hypothetical protein
MGVARVRRGSRPETWKQLVMKWGVEMVWEGRSRFQVGLSSLCYPLSQAPGVGSLGRSEPNPSPKSVSIHHFATANLVRFEGVAPMSTLVIRV